VWLLTGFFLRPVYHLFSGDARNSGTNSNPVIAMSASSVASHIRQAASRFARADEGNIAVTFAIAILPVLAFVGAAIDYSRANMARTSMQGAMDSTALMLSRDLTQGVITSSQINTKAQAYFSALFTNKETQSVSVSATYTPATSSTRATIEINGSGSIATDFMRMVGFPNMNFNTTSTTTWGASKLGLNTRDSRHGDFSGQSSEVDTRMKNLCDHAQANGVTIYTVQIDGAGEPAALPYCGSGSSRLVMPTQPGQISNAFQPLRVTK
jgi:Flp pilus assembly protein TadG